MGERSSRWELGQKGQGLSIPGLRPPQSHRRSPRCGKLAPGWREEMPRERRVQSKLGVLAGCWANLSLEQFPRKNKIIPEKRQQWNFQHSLQDGSRGRGSVSMEGCGQSGGRRREIGIRGFPPGG